MGYNWRAQDEERSGFSTQTNRDNQPNLRVVKGGANSTGEITGFLSEFLTREPRGENVPEPEESVNSDVGIAETTKPKQNLEAFFNKSNEVDGSLNSDKNNNEMEHFDYFGRLGSSVDEDIIDVRDNPHQPFLPNSRVNNAREASSSPGRGQNPNVTTPRTGVHDGTRPTEQRRPRPQRMHGNDPRMRPNHGGRVQTSQNRRDRASYTRRPEPALTIKSIAFDIGKILLVALVIWLGVRAYVVQPFVVPSGSMTPTLKVGDRILANRLALKLENLHRSDVVVFERPEALNNHPNVKFLVKRVIGLPGDTIETRGGVVYVNQKVAKDDYIPAGVGTWMPPTGDGQNKDIAPFVVPKNTIFVMGDNRTESEDSRYFGPIPDDLVVGRVDAKFWPLNRIGFMG